MRWKRGGDGGQLKEYRYMGQKMNLGDVKALQRRRNKITYIFPYQSVKMRNMGGRIYTEAAVFLIAYVYSIICELYENMRLF